MSSVVGRQRLRLLVTASAGVLALASVAAWPTATLAAGGSVDLDQWATYDGLWQNGDINGSNSRYPEGGIVPFRLAVEGLSAGNHSIHINYDFTAGGHKAYDFLATWNGWRTPKMCSKSGGAISTMCPSLPAPSSRAFPSDAFVANSLPVDLAEAYSGVSRRLTIWGGTITSISGPVHSGSVNGNSSADFVVKFSSKGSAVLLAWGGHLAQSAYWDKAAGGARDGAGEVSGAPWHMRTLQLDGAGNKNQDRSIQPSAIVGELPPFALAPSPSPTPRPSPGRTSAPGAPDPRTPPDSGTTTGNLPTPPPTSTEPELGSSGGGGWPVLAMTAWLATACMLLLAVAARRSRRRVRRDGRRSRGRAAP